MLGGGRMGTAISALLPNSTKVHVFSRLREDNLNAFSEILQNCDGVIDFSNPNNIEFAITACLQTKKPFFCGTTGLSEAQNNALKTAGDHIPVLYAANTSLGIVVLKKIASLVAKTLGTNTDIEIAEVHHRHKKDAPSGTALAIGETIADSLGYKLEQIQSWDRQHPRSLNVPEIGFTSLRGGNVVGKHSVHFFHGDETISLTHECLNRNIFAEGAIKASTWLFAQKPGFYTLENMLNLE
jgi:4-hydroxy-tetrahydrodipicolinate reductase